MINEKRLPLVSVCICAYNHDKYIAKAIQSVIDQTYHNIELIIINDGSTDKTDEVIKSFIDECMNRFVRFEYISRENRGLSATVNETIEWSKGKYYTGVASDDIMLNNKVELLVEALENIDETYAVAFGNAQFIDKDNNIVALDERGNIVNIDQIGAYLNFLDFYTKRRFFDYKGNEFGSYKTIIRGNYLPSMSYVAKLDLIKDAGGLTSGNTMEDWEMWLKLSKKYKFAYIDKPVALYRWHDSNAAKTMGLQLTRDSLYILLREKNYSCRNVFTLYCWIRLYVGLTKDLLIHKDFKASISFLSKFFLK